MNEPSRVEMIRGRVEAMLGKRMELGKWKQQQDAPKMETVL
jgi:hypothetical protein